ACAQPSSLRRARCSKRYATRNISCRAEHYLHSPIRKTKSRASQENGRCTFQCCMATAHRSRRALAAPRSNAYRARRACNLCRSRSEERRVGKECKSWWSAEQGRKKGKNKEEERRLMMERRVYRKTERQ